MKKIDILSSQPELIQKAKDDYTYQLELTAELDNYTGKDFTNETILKIVLWKVNRYPLFNDNIVSEINDLRSACTQDKARSLLAKLLGMKGFDLPMASTVLRFACPDQFQIIDKRVYRFITPEVTTLKLPGTVTKKVDFYFDYLSRLKDVCLTYDICFHEVDRILYQIDKSENKQHRL